MHSSKRMNILTFNPEDWYNGNISPKDTNWERFEYRVDKMVLPILDFLDQKKVKATFFCMGWLADNHPELVREIANRGHQIGCNSYMHAEPNTLTKEQFYDDVKRSREILEKVSGKSVEAYRAPSFATLGIEEWYFDVLKDLGFKYDCSIYGAKPTVINGIKEFPVCKYKGKIAYSGGGYFRLMPYRLIKSLMRNNDYVMTYFHPRDFDKEQPRWEGLSTKDRFLSYAGLDGAYDKWMKMMNDFEFVNVEEADKLIDWNK